MDHDEELIQIAERQLADAEQDYRRDPSEANQRRVMRAWSVVRRAREDARRQRQTSNPPARPTRHEDPHGGRSRLAYTITEQPQH